MTVAETDSTGANPPPACAVFVTVPGMVGIATTSTTTELPVGITPSVQSKRLPPWWGGPQYPWLGVAETSDILGGKKSLNPTCWGGELFVTTIVNHDRKGNRTPHGSRVGSGLMGNAYIFTLCLVTPRSLL